MMPECDLDDNDPLSDYLKRAPMIGSKKAAVSSCICCLGVPLNDINKLNSMRERRQNINQSEIDTSECDKFEANDEDVSKYKNWRCWKIFAENVGNLLKSYKIF